MCQSTTTPVSGIPLQNKNIRNLLNSKTRCGAFISPPAHSKAWAVCSRLSIWSPTKCSMPASVLRQPPFFSSLATPVSIIDHNGRKWLTAKEIGLCLGYADANAGTGITNLYNRHADEFTDADTCTISLMAQGQKREVRVFSETGCNKLGFFSNTSKSKEFRHWAAQVLVGSATSVNQLLQAKYRFTPDAGESECDYALLADVAARQFDIEMERIESMRVRIAQKFMPNANNKELEEVLEQIGQNLNCELLTGSEV